MRFIKELNPAPTDAQPPANKPVPMRPKDAPKADENGNLADLSTVAKRLRVSKRFVQMLVRRKLIPVIRLGRRCTRFDLDSVMNAVKRFEVREAQ
jgi:excisionase family DNA binding protein